MTNQGNQSKWGPEINNGHSGLPKIKVMGLGGGGCNIVQYMADKKMDGPEFIFANTDTQHLNGFCEGGDKLYLGKTGLGAGSNPVQGASAAESSVEDISEALKDTDMLFIAAGMGGGTGTGAAPVVAQLSKELDILTVAVVTYPFKHEGPHRRRLADEGIDKLEQNVHSTVVIYNEKLLELPEAQDKDEDDMYPLVNDVLYSAVMGISNLALYKGKRNLDFKDVTSVMRKQGHALIGLGRASGENRALEAVRKAVINPLTDNIDTSTKKAQGALINLRGGKLTLPERGEVNNFLIESGYISEYEDTLMKWGDTRNHDDLAPGELEVTVLLTGLDRVRTLRAAEPVGLQSQMAANQGSAQPFVQGSQPASGQFIDQPTAAQSAPQPTAPVNPARPVAQPTQGKPFSPGSTNPLPNRPKRQIEISPHFPQIDKDTQAD